MNKTSHPFRTAAQAIAIAWLMLCLASCGTHTATEAGAGPFRYIIYYDSEAAKQKLLSLAAARGDTVLYQYTHFNAIALTISSCPTREKARKTYSRQKGVLQMTEDRIMELE